MLSKEDKEQILNSYKWIKVKSLRISDDLTWEEKYKLLKSQIF